MVELVDAGSGRASAVWKVRAPWLAIAATAGTVVLGEHYSRMSHRNVVDDAMTSMQYAKQLVLGNGLVFNAGERVEGYTNFLWVMFMAPLFALSRALGTDFVALVVHVNALIAAAAVGLTFVVARRLWGEHHLATWVALGLCLVDNAYTVWAGLGLEVHFLAFWMLLALVLAGSELPRRGLWVGLSLSAVHLTRPDAGLFCATLIGSEIVEALAQRRRGETRAARRTLLDAALMSAVWVLIYGAYFAWRYRYYGALFPNTYYLKLAGEIDAWERGLNYLEGFLDERGFVPLIALLALPAIGDKTVRTLYVHVSLHTLYVLYAGGDFFPGHRFFVPEIPQLALLAGAALSVIWRAVQSKGASTWLSANGVPSSAIAGFGCGCALLALGALWVRGVELGPVQGAVLGYRDELSRQKRLLAWLREHKAPDASMATCLIGHTGFYGEVRVIDVCGVIDPKTARRDVPNFGRGEAGHEKKASVSEVLAQRPTYVGIFVLSANLWHHGYYLEAGVPDDTFEGIWVRDTITERGRYLPHTRVSFDGERPPGWRGTGTAFESWPSRRNWLGQGELVGASSGFINSFHPALGTRAMGTLRSAPFELEGDLLVFRMAGGNDPERLQVNLWIDGRRVHTTSGKRGDLMSRRAWDIRPYRGRTAELEIVDRASDNWGYIAVDEIVQWVGY